MHFVKIIISDFSAFTNAFTGTTVGHWYVWKKRCRFSKKYCLSTRHMHSLQLCMLFRFSGDRWKHMHLYIWFIYNYDFYIFIYNIYIYIYTYTHAITHTTALSHLWVMRKNTYLNPWISIIKQTSPFNLQVSALMVKVTRLFLQSSSTSTDSLHIEKVAGP